MRKWTEHLKEGTNVRTLLDNRLLNTPCPSWACTKGVVIAAWLKGWEWGHVTEESQEGVVISYRQGFIKRQIAQWVEDTQIVLKR